MVAFYIAIGLTILFIIGGICASVIELNSKYHPEGYHSEAMDSQGGILWVSDTDPNDSFWG